MKKIILTFFILTIVFVAVGQTNYLIGDWKLIAIENNTSNHVDSLTSKEDIITISFTNDTIFKGHLSRNTFWGQYYSHDENIRFNKSIAVTEICCDNEMDGSFLNQLRMTNKFLIKDNCLFLTSKLATFTLIHEE